MNSPPLHIAIVDDNAHISKTLCQVAERMGFVAHAYRTGSAFLHSTEATMDGIILDLGLPDSDGIALLDHISTNHAASGIIVISGKEESVIHAAGELIGVRKLNLIGTLHKPFRLKALQKLLTTIRGERRGDTRPPDSPSQPISADMLQKALLAGQFVPYYQPQVITHDGTIVGCEALMRWHHPEWGVVAPGRFIGLASRFDLLDRMTWEMLRRVAADWQQTAWRQETVSVNLSASFLTQKKLPEKLLRLTSSFGIDPSQLILEVTESEALRDTPHQLNNLIRLRLAGFQLSIDDFGTGYSSLISLYQIPFNELKIDQTFVMCAAQDMVAVKIIQALVFLADKLHITLIAEGVETDAVRQILDTMGVERIQGYLIQRPMPFDALLKWHAEYQPQLLPDVAAEITTPQETPLQPASTTAPNAPLALHVEKTLLTELTTALINRANDQSFCSIFERIFQAGEGITPLLALLLRSEWEFLQQELPRIRQLPDEAQYAALKEELDFFNQLRQLAVMVKEAQWQKQLQQAEGRVHQEHLKRIIAENSIRWLRRKKIKITSYLDEVPVHALANLIDIIGHTIIVALSEDLAQMLTIDDFRVWIITQDGKERIRATVHEVKKGKVQFMLGKSELNTHALRRHVRVRHPLRPSASLTFQDGTTIDGHLVDLSISGAALALPLKIQDQCKNGASITCTIILGTEPVSGKGTICWRHIDQPNDQLLCGISLSCNANDQRRIQEETLRLQRDLISGLHQSKLPYMLRTALSEMHEAE
ncbi:MAG: EAL domain-containing protein [Mariprofundales bacterium]|nr:EAL domain-containing protein [Mariprofundales bacterium]